MIPLLIPLSLCFGLGIFVGFIGGVSANLFAYAVLIFLGTSVYFTKSRIYLLCATFFFLGAWRFSVVEEKANLQVLNKLAGDSSILLKVRGAAATAPSERIADLESNTVLRTSCHFDISHILDGEKWKPANGRILVTIRGPCKIFNGDVAEVDGLITKPAGAFAPGMFDYAKWLRSQGILYELRVDSANEWRLIEHSVLGRWTGEFITWAKENLARGLPVRDKGLGLEWAMVLGWRSGLQGEVKEPYLRSGTMHIFAISGMHIALMAGILLIVLKASRVPRRVSGLITIPILWFYTAATGWQPSAIRASLMMSILLTGYVLSRPPSLLNSLAASALILLAVDPRELFQAGFQLSFMVVAALAIVPPMIEKFLKFPLFKEQFVPERLLTRFQIYRAVALNWFAKSMVFSLAATLGSFPLIMYYFNLVTPVSLFANIIVSVLSTVALASAMGSLIVGWIIPPIGELFNHSTWFWMVAMDKTSMFFADLPMAAWHVRKPPLVFVVNFYAALICFIAIPRNKKLFLSMGAVLTVACIFNLAAPLIADRNIVRITALPLGGGESIYVDNPGSNNDLLFDTGDNIAAERTIDFLHAHGVDSIKHLVLSHGDVRHVGGASLVATNLQVTTVYRSPVNFRSRPYKVELETLATNTVSVSKLTVNEEVAGWKVLHPGTNLQHRIADEMPLVLLGNIKGTKVLLLSDLSPEGQRQMLDAHPGLKADLIITGLPSQGQPVIDDLLGTLSPQAIVITDADNPWPAKATVGLRDRLADRSVFYCSDEGTVTLEFTSHAWRLSTMRGRKAMFERGP